ncbi:MAG: YybH family protein [Steroidobacteraceae bacterium]
MKRSTFATCILCGAAIFGCSRTDTLPADVTGALEQAITRHDLAATVALFADDAQILPQHGPAIRGREEIEAYFKDSITPKVAYDTDTEMTLVRGDLAVEQGRYRVRNVRRGSDVEDGKYLHVWRRMGTDWKLYRLIYNTDVEPRTQVSIEPAREEG